jgi:hypothetical protein
MIVVLEAGGGGLLLLMHPARLQRIASESVTMRIKSPRKLVAAKANADCVIGIVR